MSHNVYILATHFIIIEKIKLNRWINLIYSTIKHFFFLKAKQDESSDSEEEESGSEKSGSDSESGSESEVNKGATKINDIENPNRIVKKVKKVENINSEDKPELSRREREEIEKQKARENYQRLHAQGKTDEARADLARLAIIRQQREEAAKKRDEEKKRKFFNTKWLFAVSFPCCLADVYFCFRKRSRESGQNDLHE